VGSNVSSSVFFLIFIHLMKSLRNFWSAQKVRNNPIFSFSFFFQSRNLEENGCHMKDHSKAATWTHHHFISGAISNSNVSM